MRRAVSLIAGRSGREGPSQPGSGAKVANGLMELLPPVGWADVATKHDLALVHADFEHLRGDFEHLRSEGKGDIALLEARLGERLERELLRQSARFTASLFAGLTLFGVVERLT